jgi:transglutaminase-like putative cysteine protease
MRAPLRLVAAMLCFVAAAAGQAKTPPWVRAAIPAEIPAVPADAGAVVLLHETTVDVAADGMVTTRYRRVAKILTTAGRDEGVVGVWFDHDTKLRALRAWSIDPAGNEYEVRERDAIETTPADFELYTDARMKLLNIPGANPGSIVASEYEVSDKPYLPQTVWHFQEDVPVVQARLQLVLPDGWSYVPHWMNHPPVDASGGAWTLTSVPALSDEPRRPASAAIAGRLGIDFLAPGSQAQSWSAIAKWFAGLSAQRSAPTPALQAKVKELAASGDPLRSIARFCQRDVRYVAIQVGIGGYQPHAAGDVFTNRFGDCKDKANLLRAMLRETGTPAYDLLINTFRGATDPSFPTLGAFDHVIAAIALPADAPAYPAVIQHPRLGRLLLFDPTSTTTPLGELPPWLQASRGLLVTPDGGELIDLPAHPAEASRLYRSGSLAIDAEGTLFGSIEEKRTGHVGSSMRSRLQELTTAERVRMIESAVASHLPGSTAEAVSFEGLDDPEQELVVRYRVRAPKYAKRVADMLIVRPRVVGEKTEALVDVAKREHVYVTDGPSLHVDEIDIRLPEAAQLDELPPALELSTSAVQYSSASTFEGGVLRYRRRYALKNFVVPREALPELNAAWAKILGDERASAVFR